MKQSVLFPYDRYSNDVEAYFFALELCKKMNSDLKLVCAFESPHKNKSLFRLRHKNKLEETKKQLHLKLLKLAGEHRHNTNNWKLSNFPKIRTILKPGNLSELVLDELDESNHDQLILCNYPIFTKQLLPAQFVDRTNLKRFKLWILPDNKSEYSKLEKPFNWVFNTTGNAKFRTLFAYSKLYNLPTDIALLKSEYNVVIDKG